MQRLICRNTLPGVEIEIEPSEPIEGIEGQIGSQGEITLRWDPQGWKLEAPAGLNGERLHYLPCTRCDVVCAVPWNVVSFTCPLHSEF